MSACISLCLLPLPFTFYILPPPFTFQRLPFTFHRSPLPLPFVFVSIFSCGATFFIIVLDYLLFHSPTFKGVNLRMQGEGEAAREWLDLSRLLLSLFCFVSSRSILLFVLCCAVLCCLVLSCVVLSCFVLCCVALSCLVLPCLFCLYVLFCGASSCLLSRCRLHGSSSSFSS